MKKALKLYPLGGSLERVKNRSAPFETEASLVPESDSRPCHQESQESDDESDESRYSSSGSDVQRLLGPVDISKFKASEFDLG